jgi:hypothetical protein
MLTSADPEQLLAGTRQRLTARKARLFAVALARHHWHLLTDASRAAADTLARPAGADLPSRDRLGNAPGRRSGPASAWRFAARRGAASREGLAAAPERR